jgi:hypothetical protein
MDAAVINIIELTTIMKPSDVRVDSFVERMPSSFVLAFSCTNNALVKRLCHQAREIGVFTQPGLRADILSTFKILSTEELNRSAQHPVSHTDRSTRMSRTETRSLRGPTILAQAHPRLRGRRHDDHRLCAGARGQATLYKQALTVI